MIGVGFTSGIWFSVLWLGGCSAGYKEDLITTTTTTTTTSFAGSSTTFYPGTTSTTSTTAASTTTTIPQTIVWEALGEGVNFEYSPINAMVYALAEGDAGNIYAGGNFNLAGGTAESDRVAHIARWNGVSWESVGQGVSGGSEIVYAMAYDNNNSQLYVGGSFGNTRDPNYKGTIVNNIARWSVADQEWRQMGTSEVGIEVSGEVRSLAIDDDGNVYVGGTFHTAGGIPAKNIAKWYRATNTWEALGDGLEGPGPPASVMALAIFNGDIYAGGDIYLAGGTVVNNIAKWNTFSSTWENIENDIVIASFIVDMAVDNSAGKLYIVGQNLAPQGSTARMIAAYYGGSWHDLGDEFGDVVPGGVAVGTDSDVYVAVDPAIYDYSYVAKWDGSSWQKLQDDIWSEIANSQVGPIIHDSQGDLIIGGNFTHAGQVPANNIVKRLLP